MSADAKRFATARARAALRGMLLHRIDGDDGRAVFIATYRALTKHFASLDELDRWLEKVDGTRTAQEQAA
jgi:hypothetical protein